MSDTIKTAAKKVIAAWDAAENAPIGCDNKSGVSYWTAMFAAIADLRDALAEKRVQLTEDEIHALVTPLGLAMLSPYAVARAVERAHGIGKESSDET